MTAEVSGGTTAAVPPVFRDAVAAARRFAPRREIEIEELAPPQRLAPFSHAIAATVHDPAADAELGSGRMILLHDPRGVDTWDGSTRIVVFATCEVEGEIARDPLLPDVAWSWLQDALDGAAAQYTTLGGTVTATSSVQFGDISRSGRDDDVEIRASWTVVGDDVSRHLAAFAALLAVAAGLPPVGVASLSSVRPVAKTVIEH